MQRLSIADEEISQEIINNPGYGYVHLMLPMEYEPARRCATVIGLGDRRKKEGELLFPERFPAEVVDGLKAILRTAAPGQLQQNPVKVGGNLLKGEWFGRYQVVPKLEYRVIYADTAQKTKERNDYSVFGVYGKGVDGKVYVLDIVRGKWEAPELQRRAVDVWRKHKALDDPKIYGTLRRMSIEDKASGTGLIQQIKRDASCPVVAIQRNTDKLTRLMDVAGQIESGYVMLPDTAPWASDFVGECEAFAADDSHAHDDQVDTLIDAVKDMLGGGGYDIGALI
jgi:predicted phage terminase large subunit-like protein